MHVYGQLVQHYWKNIRRAFRHRNRWLTILAISVMLFNLTIVLVFTGAFLGDLLDFYYQEVLNDYSGNQVSPVSFVNRFLLEVFMGLFSLRFFLQQGPKMQLQPYLHLPISRKRLVRFFQVFSLLSLHNIIPYLFFIPFTFRTK